MNGLTVQTRQLVVRFGDTTALSDLSLDVAAGTICGLLGRNGAGKTTLLRVLAARLARSGGAVAVGGRDPYEDPEVMSAVCLVRDSGDLDDTNRVKTELELCSCLRPSWDGEYADRLLDRFGLSRRQRVGALSRGQRSALAIVIGLASRAPLTMFDEPQLGLDAPSRAAFYDELLADYLARPRTIILSTHLIDEVAPLLEHVIVLDEGRLVVQAPAEELAARGAQLTGPAAAVEAVLAAGVAGGTGGTGATDLPVLAERRLGGVRSVIVFGELDGDRRRRAAEVGVDIGPIPLQELFIGLTSKEHAS